MRNIVAVVMDVTEDGFYKLETTNGVLKQLKITVYCDCQKSLVRIGDVPDKETGLRTVESAQSLGSGQGFVRCTCKIKCQTKQSACVKNNRKYNSNSHSSFLL